MTHQPLVSIIIPTFNRAELIGETLDSIIAQTYQNWECIVVDDGSTDNTSYVLENYTKKDNRISYHYRPKKYKSGGNGARNYGLDICKGEYINWFDSDDLMHPEKLEKQLKLLINNPNFNYCVCNCYVFENEKNNLIGKRTEKLKSDNILFDYLTQKIMIMTPSTLFKKEFLQISGIRFNEKLKAAQEWEFYSKIIFYSSNFIDLEEFLVYIRQHKVSISYNESGTRIREVNYINARKFVYNIIDIKEYETERKYLYNYIKNNTEKIIKKKNLRVLNEVIFYNGINLKTLKTFFSIYFFMFTNRLKSKIKYV